MNVKVRAMLKTVSICLAVALLGLAVSDAASARTRVFLGFNFGAPVYAAPPVYYAPPPVYYYPPPPAYVAPAYVAPAYAAPAYVAPAPAPASNCRTFNGDATVDAGGQPFYGTACLGSDGLWHITGQ